MKTRQEFDRAVLAVRKLVAQWDPYALLAGGAPLDEFDSEVLAIVRQIPRIQSIEDASSVISRVFSAAFEPSQFQPSDCEEMGTELFEMVQRWKEA
ncbi:MAG: DUF1871 family protein [Pirellulales bacterium]